MRVPSIFLGALLGITACREASPPPTVPPSASPPPSATPTTTSAPLPQPFERLDKPCDPAKASEEQCADGRVVGIYHPADFLGSPPPSAEVVTTPKSVDVQTSFIAIDGDRLWIHRVTCARCRRIMGWSFIGRPSAMSDAQLLDLQRRLGLEPTVAPLRTIQAWRSQPLPSIAPTR